MWLNHMKLKAKGALKMNENELLDVKDLSKVLHMKPNAIHNRLHLGLPLPKSFMFPGGGKRLWRSSDVFEFINNAANSEVYSGTTKRRGRPTKREAIEKSKS